MRNIDRIKVYLDLLKGKTFIINGVEVNFSTISFDLLEEFWFENQDWRLTQLLVNMCIIPNMSGFWYYMEDDEFLMALGFKAREVVMWGNFFDKNMNRLSKPVWEPIKNLTTDHIEAILKTQKHLSDELRNLFEEELKIRNNQ